MSAPSHQPKPWPIKWVALVTVICIAVYTIFTIATFDQRKTSGNTHQPWAEAQARAATVQRAQTAGYKLISATTERPSDPAIMDEAITKFRATITPTTAGLPGEIALIVPVQPKLPNSILRIAAPAVVDVKTPYQILYTCQLPDEKRLLGDTYVYIKDNDIIIATNFNNLDGELRARTRETTVLLTIPAGTFEVGRTYKLTLSAADESRHWTVLSN